jgi:hypothetical protein
VRIDQLTGSSSLSLARCERCDSQLAITGISAGRPVCCASCGNIFEIGKSQTAPDKWARRSLWLGISSVLFLCFTGLPALYLGFRSLLRMRHIKARPEDRAAAIAGTILGALFGLLGGFCLLSTGAMALVVVLTFEVVRDEEQVLGMLAETAHIELPADIKPESGLRILNSQTRIQFTDSNDAAKRRVMVLLMHFAPIMQGNINQLPNELRNAKFHSSVRGDIKSREILAWQMNGVPVDIVKQIELIEENPESENSNPDVEKRAELHRYFGHFRTYLGVYGLLVIARQPESGISEDEIRKIFQSYGPALGNPQTADVNAQN